MNPDAQPGPCDDAGDAPDTDWSDLAQALIASRYSVAPKRLVAPGPDATQLQQLVEAAATAPDSSAFDISFTACNLSSKAKAWHSL